MDKEPPLTDDQLLAAPSPDTAGGLSRLWSLRAGIRQQRELDELADELSGTSSRHLMIFAEQDPALKHKRAEEEHCRAMLAEQESRAYEDRREQLLARITEEQQHIEQRRREIDENAICLNDGRRVYVDGQQYRDDKGAILKGRDHDEAEDKHRDKPHASTWKDQQEIEEQARETQSLREKVERDGDGTTAEKQQRLTLYEKELAEKMQAHAKEQPIDYGNADYMAAEKWQASSVPAFAAAAEYVSRETIGKLSEDSDGALTADANKPAKLPGGSGMKPV